MKFKPFMLVYAIVSALFGLGFIFLPGMLLSLYGFETGASVQLIAQLFGAALVSLALLAWLARDLQAPEARRIIVMALLAGEALGLILAVLGQMRGVMNVLGWAVVLVYLLFTLSLGYLQVAGE